MKTVTIRKNGFSYYGWSGSKKDMAFGNINQNNCILAKYFGRPIIHVTKELKKLHYEKLHLTSKQYADYLQMIDNLDNERANEKDIEILKEMKSKLKMRLIIR